MIAPKLSLSLLLTCAISLASFQIASAAATDTDVRNAIQAANVLDQNARLNVKVQGDVVHVSTYRDSRENEKDRKINAVLIARAAIQAAGDSISRVHVYFYGKDVSSYQEVTVTAGDVKAFASGQTTQDQLLSALTVQSKRNESMSDRVARQLEAGAYARPEYKVALNNGDSQLVVTTELADWVPDDEALVEALRIANNAVQAAPAGVKEIKVSFVDPRGKSFTREMVFGATDAKSMWQRIQGDLSDVRIAKTAPAGEAGGVGARAVAGPLQAERTKLLERLRELEKQGVGIGPFLKAFNTLEESVASGDEAAIKKSVESLSRSLDDQEKAAKAAKSGPVKTGGNKFSFSGEVKEPAGSSRWGYGPTPITAEEVMADPYGMLNRKLEELQTKVPPQQRQLLFNASIERISAVLIANGKAADAQRIRQQALQMRASLGK